MTSRASPLLPYLLAAALALPAVTAASAEVSGYTTTARAAAVQDPCRTRNVIAYRERESLLGSSTYNVRHFGRARCDVPTNIRCRAVLMQGDTVISRIEASGRNLCEMAGPFSSKRYGRNTTFREKYRYRLKLRRDDQHWTGTNQFCPKLSDNRRVLFCRDAHSGQPPEKDVETHG